VKTRRAAATMSTLPRQLKSSRPGTVAKNCLPTPRSRSRPESRPSSPTRVRRGSAVPTRTRIGLSGSTFRKGQTRHDGTPMTAKQSLTHSRSAVGMMNQLG
jgi:hypothetical protein